jgi:hypothetical protein
MQITVKDWENFKTSENNIICVKACVHVITLAMVGITLNMWRWQGDISGRDCMPTI